MAMVEPLYQLMMNPFVPISKEEAILLEMDLFVRVCEELKEIFKIQYKDYFRTIRFSAKKEDQMMEKNYIRFIINDILSTEEYSLSGIAYYTNTPEEVVFDIATGKNTDPSSSFLRKLIELHRTVRPLIYRSIIKKIVTTEF